MTHLRSEMNLLQVSEELQKTLQLGFWEMSIKEWARMIPEFQKQDVWKNLIIEEMSPFYHVIELDSTEDICTIMVGSWQLYQTAKRTCC